MRKLYFTIPIFVLFGYFSFGQIKQYETQRVADENIRIDGHFDEKIWSEKEWESNFSQFEPNNGQKPSQESAFKLLYDDNHIYIAIKNYDSEPDKIDQRLTRRDGFEGDICGIELDSYFDKRTAFVFLVSAAGVKTDGIFTSDSEEIDLSLDLIWFVATKIVSDGWQAEIKIPLSQLRFGTGDELIWGMQVTRFLFRKEELNVWQPVSKSQTGWVRQFGHLKGLKDIKPKKLVEIAPYVLTRVNAYEKEAGNPFKDGLDYGLDAGLDAKVGITNDLILNLSINPDFGQVEADPSEVNLTAFESFFEEKRPFFIEGTNLTNYQITPGGSPWSRDNLFYSRRIGRSPQYYPDLSDEEYVDFPGQSRILGSAKLTGKTKNGWSIGVIEGLVDTEVANIDLNGKRREIVVEPMTNYLVGKIQKDLDQGNTIIGGMFTSTNRFLKEDHLDFLVKDAYTAGIDFIQFFKQKTYFVGTTIVGSAMYGSENAILEQQTSSRRYFQRPDADYLEVDENRRSLFGHGGNVSFGRSANSGFRFLANVTWRSPGLEMNDVGYMRRADNVFQLIWAGYEFLNPFKSIRKLSLNTNQWSGWDFGGTRLFLGMNLYTRAEFSNLWSCRFSYNYDFPSIDNGDLRGGPALHFPQTRNFGFGIHSAQTKKLVFEVDYHRAWAIEGESRDQMMSFGLRYRPMNALSVNLNQQIHLSHHDLQYVDQYHADTDQNYLYATLDQKIYSLTFRLDYNITPEFTVQYYASPFITAGLYNDYKRITDPDALTHIEKYELLSHTDIRHFFNQVDDMNFYEIDRNADGIPDFSFDNPDFNFKQFRSNLVARWEYQPGSVLYLVWSEDRTGSVVNGNLNYWSDMKDLFRITANDVFLLKLSHRFRFDTDYGQ